MVVAVAVDQVVLVWLVQVLVQVLMVTLQVELVVLVVHTLFLEHLLHMQVVVVVDQVHPM
jgi:hypothetical protein